MNDPSNLGLLITCHNITEYAIGFSKNWSAARPALTGIVNLCLEQSCPLYITRVSLDIQELVLHLCGALVFQMIVTLPWLGYQFNISHVYQLLPPTYWYYLGLIWIELQPASPHPRTSKMLGYSFHWTGQARWVGNVADMQMICYWYITAHNLSLALLGASDALKGR